MNYATFSAGYGAKQSRIRCATEDVANLADIELSDENGNRFKLVSVTIDGKESPAVIDYKGGLPRGFKITSPGAAAINPVDEKPAPASPKFKRGDWVYWMDGCEKRFGIVTKTDEKHVYFLRNYAISSNYTFGQQAQNFQIIMHHADPAETWIEWRGGACPVRAGVPIEVMGRDGWKSVTTLPETLRWGNTGGRGDIIAYRVALMPAYTYYR